MQYKEVVITGVGAITPLGNSVNRTWDAVKRGESGVDFITRFDTSSQKVKYAAEVKGFDAPSYMDLSSARKMALFSRYAVAAAKEALEDSTLIHNQEVLDEMPCILGVGIGGFEVTESSMGEYFSSGKSRTPPLTIPMLIPNEAAGNIAMQFHLHGETHTILTACSSSTDAIGEAFRLVRSGEKETCLTGGAESTINGFTFISFEALHALSSGVTNPKEACCPFSANRCGFVMGEGSAILVLEEKEHAVKRGAKIYAQVLGYGGSTDGFHLTAPDPTGKIGSLAMKRALKMAGLLPEKIDYYNAHGTGTKRNDKAETLMLKETFGEEGAKHLTISSTKSMHGHCLGATGAIEAVICVKAMQESFAPPTINLTNQDIDGGCDLNYTALQGIKKSIEYSMSATFGFGGHNGVLVFKKG